MRRKRAKAKELGMCSGCGIRPPDGERATCRVCLDRASKFSTEKQRAYRARKKEMSK